MNKIRVKTRKDTGKTETIDVTTPEGMQRVQELLRRGHICHHGKSMCVKCGELLYHWPKDAGFVATPPVPHRPPARIVLHGDGFENSLVAVLDCSDFPDSMTWTVDMPTSIRFLKSAEVKVFSQRSNKYLEIPVLDVGGMSLQKGDRLQVKLNISSLGLRA